MIIKNFFKKNIDDNNNDSSGLMDNELKITSVRDDDDDFDDQIQFDEEIQFDDDSDLNFSDFDEDEDDDIDENDNINEDESDFEEKEDEIEFDFEDEDDNQIESNDEPNVDVEDNLINKDSVDLFDFEKDLKSSRDSQPKNNNNRSNVHHRSDADHKKYEEAVRNMQTNLNTKEVDLHFKNLNLNNASVITTDGLRQLAKKYSLRSVSKYNKIELIVISWRYLKKDELVNIAKHIFKIEKTSTMNKKKLIESILATKNLLELKKIAKKLEIKGYSTKKTKQELIDLIIENRKID